LHILGEAENSNVSSLEVKLRLFLFLTVLIHLMLVSEYVSFADSSFCLWNFTHSWPKMIFIWHFRWGCQFLFQP